MNKETKNLTFKEAYNFMLQGKKIKRPSFKGWYFIDYLDGKLAIHLANGIEIKEGDIHCTVMNVLANDWEVMDEDEPTDNVNNEQVNKRNDYVDAWRVVGEK